ncbi:TolC family outer membrane protein [Desulfovibrio oxamicus]|uniref:TolC family outer membrane protein n=1 Tax=Nitratidesulfovibrio oxamicus TaxID=32016 RepID=A0ABS0J6I0_9BACT|nr:TolC family outer membrane protein [Nitratidesulfovibrio oxamicus]MBG3878062.1 TolC family outer membrane protein [Nitratidesulfovibrio oxamicus]
MKERKSQKRRWLAFCALAAVLGLAIGVPAQAQEVTLKDSVVNTLETHPRLKAFQENRQAAEHDVDRARAGWFPRLDVRGGVGVEQYNDRSTRATNNENDWYDRSEGSVTLSQTIWDGLATASRVDINTNKLGSVDNRLIDNAEALGLDAVLAHIEVLRQREIVRLSEINVQQHESILGSQQERSRMGAASVSDVTQTQGRLARAQSTLTEARAALQVAEAAYLRLTGKVVPETLGPAEAPTATPPSADAALVDSQSSNPKVQALISDVRTSEAEIDLAKSGYHPVIYAEVGPTYKDQVESSRDHEWGTAAMLRMSWNLFNGGADVAAVKGASARSRQSRQELQNQIDELGRETRSTWSQMLSAREQQRYFQSAIDYNVQTRDAYMQQFLVGQRSLLDVLDAENELYSSSIQEVTSRMNDAGAQYRLLALGGKLLESLGIDRDALRKPTAQ